MEEIKLSILIATSGRESLLEVLKQLKNDVKDNDEVVIVMDRIEIPNYHVDFPNFKFIRENKDVGYWGHSIRTKHQTQLKGEYVLHMDDDDLYCEGWREQIDIELYNNNYPEMITFSSYIEYSNKIKLAERNKRGVYDRCTINTLVKNELKYIKLPWGKVRGGDVTRYQQIENLIIKNNGNVCYSDFPLVKINRKKVYKK